MKKTERYEAALAKIMNSDTAQAEELRSIATKTLFDELINDSESLKLELPE